MDIRFMRKIVLTTLLLLTAFCGFSTQILIPMDNIQSNHLKAYGITYWVLTKDVEVYWLLNYRGGSFMMKNHPEIENELIVRGVRYEIIPDAKSTAILAEIANPEINMDAVKLEKAPKIAVYSPKNKLPWDDAVTLVLTYAEIPYTVIYDEEIVNETLPLYDWLHLHHEDFTGMYGKFYGRYKNYPWYQEQVRVNEAMANKLGFSKVSLLKLDVAKKIQAYIAGGGFMFSMCSGTDSYDIALAAQHTDICEHMFDGDPATPGFNNQLDFSQTFAFKNFKVSTNPLEPEFSNIDATPAHSRYYQQHRKPDVFTLFDFSAKWDPVPTMLCQNHESVISGFMGLTTAYNKELIKPGVLILGENKSLGSAKYLHGKLGKGTWTFYGGHDPEDFQHFVGDPPTDLNLYPNSPGYRLILNNVLFPAAKKKKQKT
jgi:hypothetical protein